MINAIIVEDEQPLQELIAIMACEVAPDVRILGAYDSVDAALPAVRQLQPDLIFLDVMLPGGTGFELLERLGDVQAEVIFISAHDHFAITAFQHAAIGYVMKPIDSQALGNAIAIARKRIGQSGAQGHNNLDQLLRNLQQANAPASNRIALPAQTGYIFADAKDIVRCEGQGAYTSIFLHSGRRILCSRNLGVIRSLLPEQSFVQIHRSHIVAVEAILRFDSGESTVELTDGAVLPVARNNKQALLNYFRML